MDVNYYAQENYKNLSKKYLNGTYNQQNNDIILYYVDSDGSKKREVISGFYPYFYVRVEDRLILLNYRKLIKSCNPYTDKYLKLEFETVPILVQVRNSLRIAGIQTFESDIPFVRRFMIDHNIMISGKPLRIAYIDIETNKKAIGNVKLSKIFSVSIHDDNGQNTIICEGYERETLLILSMELVKYDIMVAYYGNKFDFPIIQYLFEKYNIPFDWNTIQTCDMYEIYRKSRQQDLDSYSLDNVAKYELGEEKIKVDASNIETLYLTNRDLLRKYNAKDTELLYKLDKKLRLVRLQEQISEFSGVFINQLSPNVIVDMVVLRRTKLLKPWMVYPDNNTDERTRDKFSGAMVLSPIAGLHENVAFLDFVSLYNRIIQTFNISPETYDVNGGIQIPIATDDTEKYSGVYRFSKTEYGILPQVLKELEIMRNEYKFKMRECAGTDKEYGYYMLQWTVKTILLSFWGIIGQQYSRYFNKNIAMSITGTARFLIKNTIQHIQEMGFKVVYGDTDSVAIVVDSKNDVLAILDNLNSFYNLLLKPYNIYDNKIKLDFSDDDFFKVLLFTGTNQVGTKKRYGGLVEYEKDGRLVSKLIVKGLEIIRSDWNRIARTMQKQVLLMILNKTPESDVINYILSIQQKLLLHQVDSSDLIISKSITKDISEYGGKTINGIDKRLPPHIQIAVKLKQSGDDIYVGKKIGYIVIKSNPIVPICPDDFIGEFDVTYYWNKAIFPPTYRLISSVYSKDYRNLQLIPSLNNKLLSEWMIS